MSNIKSMTCHLSLSPSHLPLDVIGRNFIVKVWASVFNFVAPATYTVELTVSLNYASHCCMKVEIKISFKKALHHNFNLSLFICFSFIFISHGLPGSLGSYKIKTCSMP